MRNLQQLINKIWSTLYEYRDITEGGCYSEAMFSTGFVKFSRPRVQHRYFKLILRTHYGEHYSIEHVKMIKGLWKFCVLGWSTNNKRLTTIGHWLLATSWYLDPVDEHTKVKLNIKRWGKK